MGREENLEILRSYLNLALNISQKNWT